MMRAPERSPERDAALDALLPLVPFEGWTMTALRHGLRDAGLDPEDADLLFPGGTLDLIEAHSDLADRRMEAVGAAPEFAAMRLPAKVRGLIAARLERSRGDRDAIRRALGILALPRNAMLAAGIVARTVDTIWHAAGDRSADFSWYTKRAILTGVYSSTLLFWLRDESDDHEATLAFLDRRLAGVARLGKMRRRAEERLKPRRAAGSGEQGVAVVPG